MSIKSITRLKMDILCAKRRPVVDFIKLFGGNLDFPKIKKLNKVCSNV